MRFLAVSQSAFSLGAKIRIIVKYAIWTSATLSICFNHSFTANYPTANDNRDLAMLYGVTTSRLNEQVKRNRARFPESFRFQLTEAERDEVVAICDNLRSLKYNPSLPYVFTEQGIAQLSSVLHSPIAIEVSIRIMNAFVAMRRFMIQNAAVLMRIAHLEKHNTQYPEIAFIQLPHRNHDRFLIIDDKVYLLGASLKDIGAGLCAVTEMTIAPEVILGMVR